MWKKYSDMFSRRVGLELQFAFVWMASLPKPILEKRDFEMALWKNILKALFNNFSL